MDNQHRLIKSYRDLSKEEIDLVNKIKAQGEALDVLIEEVNQHLIRQWDGLTHPNYGFDGRQVSVEDQRTPEQKAEYDRLSRAEPHLWRMHARRKLQEGLMLLVRSVTQPEGF